MTRDGVGRDERTRADTSGEVHVVRPRDSSGSRPVSHGICALCLPRPLGRLATPPPSTPPPSPGASAYRSRGSGCHRDGEASDGQGGHPSLPSDFGQQLEPHRDLRPLASPATSAQNNPDGIETPQARRAQAQHPGFGQSPASASPLRRRDLGIAPSGRSRNPKKPAGAAIRNAAMMPTLLSLSSVSSE